MPVWFFFLWMAFVFGGMVVVFAKIELLVRPLPDEHWAFPQNRSDALLIVVPSTLAFGAVASGTWLGTARLSPDNDGPNPLWLAGGAIIWVLLMVYLVTLLAYGWRRVGDENDDLLRQAPLSFWSGGAFGRTTRFHRAYAVGLVGMTFKVHGRSADLLGLPKVPYLLVRALTLIAAFSGFLAGALRIFA